MPMLQLLKENQQGDQLPPPLPPPPPPPYKLNPLMENVPKRLDTV